MDSNRKITPLQSSGLYQVQAMHESTTCGPTESTTSRPTESTTDRPTESTPGRATALTRSSGRKIVGLGLMFLCVLASLEGLVFFK